MTDRDHKCALGPFVIPLCESVCETMFQKVFINEKEEIICREGVGLTLASMLIEMSCPKHGLERFKVRIVKRFNIASGQITPKLRSKPVRGELSSLYVGRNVTYNEVEDYLVGYFREKGMLEEIVRMKLLV